MSSAAKKAVIAIESADHLARELKENRDVVLDFWAEWCGPCMRIAPDVEKMAQADAERKVRYLKVNVDDCDDIATAYDITKYPTFLIFRNGAVVKTHVGADVAKLRAAINDSLCRCED